MSKFVLTAQGFDTVQSNNIGDVIQRLQEICHKPKVPKSKPDGDLGGDISPEESLTCSDITVRLTIQESGGKPKSKFEGEAETILQSLRMFEHRADDSGLSDSQKKLRDAHNQALGITAPPPPTPATAPQTARTGYQPPKPTIRPMGAPPSPVSSPKKAQ